jgi:RNA polymerase sigma-70 factor (ECF subfamily)
VPTTSNVSAQDDLYRQAAADQGDALARLARGYEADPEKRRELLQEIHVALWRSLAGFQARCSLRTWVYRVAHNTAATWISTERRARPALLVSLEELNETPVAPDAERRLALDQLTQLIQRLKPLDREVILGYLEGMDAAAIGELTGLSARNVATKIHRIKNLLARSFQSGVRHAE